MSLVDTKTEKLPLWKRLFGGPAAEHTPASAPAQTGESRSVMSAEQIAATTTCEDAHPGSADARSTERLLTALRDLDGAKSLLAQGADLHATDSNGRTLLHQATLYGNKEVVELLLDHGANVNARNAFGFAPLHTAARFGMKDVADLLIARGANVNIADNYGGTPLQFAAERGHADIAELLRRHGAEESLPMAGSSGAAPGGIVAVVGPSENSPVPPASTQDGDAQRRQRVLEEHTAVGALAEQAA